ncbi:PEGA domain-containing protein [Oleiharenicola lentus]|uniref:PEGA domain-containing protein n=1 Tax=Oleiharenicola lentus TaxID=2508720 RepID=UPI003F66A01F
MLKFLNFALTFTALGAAAAFAQNEPKSSVQKKTYTQNGQNVTERTVTTVVTEAEPQPQNYTVAIFTTSRVKEADADLGALEDYITGRVTDLNFNVISGETALNAVSSLAPGAKATELDKQLAQGTSAVRLAQTLGANYLLQVSIAGADSQKNTLDAYGVKQTNDLSTVRVTYKILDGNNGASLAADTVRVSRTYQETSGNKTDRSNIFNDLLDEAAVKVAASLKNQIARGRITATSPGQGLVTVTLTTELGDVYIPDVRIGAENTISISDSKFKVSVLNATVEVDGIAVGTAPGAIEVKGGLHKLRITREGFKPWERTVNFSNGQKLNAVLEMSEAGYARWQNATTFINELKNGAKLTDADVKRIEGEAKMLEQSGYRVDTKDAPQITNKSLF